MEIIATAAPQSHRHRRAHNKTASEKSKSSSILDDKDDTYKLCHANCVHTELGLLSGQCDLSIRLLTDKTKQRENKKKTSSFNTSRTGLFTAGNNLTKNKKC